MEYVNDADHVLHADDHDQEEIVLPYPHVTAYLQLLFPENLYHPFLVVACLHYRDWMQIDHVIGYFQSHYRNHLLFFHYHF